MAGLDLDLTFASASTLTSTSTLTFMLDDVDLDLDLFFSNNYKVPPLVRVSAPDSPDGVQAEARAVLDKRQGFISAIEITNPGSGYSTALAPVTVEVCGCVTD